MGCAHKEEKDIREMKGAHIISVCFLLMFPPSLDGIP